MERIDLDEKIDILEILEKQVVFLENQELANSLSHFRSQNVQWVLNWLQQTLGEAQDVLDLEDFSNTWS